MRITIEIDQEDAQLRELRSRVPLTRHALARAALRAGLQLLIVEPSRVAELLGPNRVQVSALASTAGIVPSTTG